ncbi:MAG: CRISPR-associated endonuclease Cas3'' [Rhodospirillaceae bacterium]
MDKTFYAHSLQDRPEADWEPLAHHLRRTSALAGVLAAPFGGRNWGRAAGLLHDAGKYRAAFQARIRGSGLPAEHAGIGALLGTRQYTGSAGRVLAYAIAGHHTGLPDGGGGSDSALALRLARAGEMEADMPAFPETAILPPPPLALPGGLRMLPPERRGFSLHFFTRMLFSALCDADFLCTEAFYDGHKAVLRRHAGYSLAAMQTRLDVHLKEKSSTARAAAHTDKERAILAARDAIGHDCRTRAALPPGVFALQVPTGGGKTLASLAFALAHARIHGLRRVIYVIPYTSIIEQTAQAFRDALGPGLADAVLEHHSAAVAAEGEEPIGLEKRKLAAENWDHPLIVTTTVQFFESLFAARPAQCRKLHNIAGSVVILDEVQTLPAPLLQPCVAALEQLTTIYGCTVLLCSATQPDLAHRALKWPLPPVREIVGDVPRLFAVFERCRAEYAGRLSGIGLVTRLRAEPQVLCIVDQRAHAAELFATIAGEDAFHLSAAMCPAHRRAVLSEVKHRLATGAPCRLIATQVVEAGVDISFPAVFRAAAGIDSLMQAAGRCNRNGEGPMGRFVVFDIDRDLPLPELSRRREIARPLLARGADPLSREAVADYFRALFDVSTLDLPGIMRMCAERAADVVWPFREIAESFRIIGQDTVQLIVPYGNADALCARLQFCAARGIPPSLDEIVRPLQQVGVAVYRSQLARLDAAGAIGRIGPDGRFARLVKTEFYDPQRGLWAPNPNRSPNDNIL